jgi:hypothetical protein
MSSELLEQRQACRATVFALVFAKAAFVQARVSADTGAYGYALEWI